jgi:hypothetical protein
MVRNSIQREEKQKKRNQMIVGIFITVIMVGSTLGYFVGNNSSASGIEYESKNGEKYSFEQGSSQIYTKINGKIIGFYSHPVEALNLNISEEAVYLLKNAQVFYLTFNPNSRDIQYIEQARFDLEKDFIGLKKYSVSGITENSTLYNNFEIITCKNSTVYAPVVNFIEANGTNAFGYVKNSCIIFEGKRTDFLKFRDFIVYKLYDVI